MAKQFFLTEETVEILNRPDEKFAEVPADEDIMHTPSSRHLKLNSEDKVLYRSKIRRFFMRLLWWIVWPVMWWLYRVFLGLRCVHKRNLNKFRFGKKKPVVTVSNHIHVLDCVLNVQLYFPRKLYVTTQQSNFEIPFAGSIVRVLGGVPIPDEVGYMKYFRNSVDYLLKEEKRAVQVYPEASMHLYRTDLRPFKRGAFNFAVRNNVPVMPVVYVMRKAGGLWKLFKKKPAFTAIIGTELHHNPELSEREATIDLMNRTHKAMERLLAEGILRLKPRQLIPEYQKLLAELKQNKQAEQGARD